MPTYDWDARFMQDYRAPRPDRRLAFLTAVAKLVVDLAAQRGPRAGLRVKAYRGQPGVFEMTWAPDGRALFRYGEPVRSGHEHIVWLRVGTHDIFE